jgi:protein tyrosine/serine phosphatase
VTDPARRLAWPDCHNVRDVGGRSTTNRGTVRVGALVRGDSPHRLTADGVAALHAYGIRRVIDLRSAEEAEAAPGPFADDPIYELRPMIDPRAEVRRNAAAESTLELTYRASLVRNASHITAGIAAIADAPAGGVFVHCASGKDRTGMVVALALRVAGVDDDAIAADYAYTSVCLGARIERALAAAPSGAERARLAEVWGSRPDTILAMLDRVDVEFGAVEQYLTRYGVSDEQLDRLRRRLTQDR